MPEADGKVLSLHIHPPDHREEMLSVPELDLVADKGILQDKRYYGRKARDGGLFKRQVTLIEREQIDEHAAVLGMIDLAPGRVRSNIETGGITLRNFLGREVAIGDALLVIVEHRDPCARMDQIFPGLRRLMDNGRQGVIARVIRSGKIRIGDPIRIANHNETAAGS